MTCTLLYSIKHPNPTFSKTAALINIHSSFYLVTILSFMSLILCPFLVFFEEKKRVVRHINFLYLYFLLCHTDSVPPNIQQLTRCMRKMPSHILILKCKAIEMSSERFRSVKCNENIFVWKYHNQHSCALRTVWGKKNWRPCQMHSAPASVIFFIINGFDWFLKVIECEMCILNLYWILPSTVVRSLSSLKQID